VQARKHSAFAATLISAFVAKNPSTMALRKQNRHRFRGAVRRPAPRQLWWVIRMRVCIKLITRAGYRWQLLAIAVGVLRLGFLS
jgi:hypothetical protein